jgi:hypothetical protein
MNASTDGTIARRYPMSFALRYETAAPELARRGVGETVWMSGREVAFLAQGPMGVGDKVALHIEWPVLLEGGVPLQLTATAQIVQSSGPLCIAKVVKHEFRTRGIQSSSMGVRHRLSIPAWSMPRRASAVASLAGR